LKTDADKDEAVKGVADASRRPQARPTAKRKLVGDAVASKDKDNGKGKDGEKSKKKKKKAVKGLLSFDEAEGE
jgi:hypothetical protein